MLPGKLYRFGNLNSYVNVWTSDWGQILKRLKKDDLFMVLSCGKKHMGETIIKVLTSDGIVGYTAIADRDPGEKLFMVSPSEDGNFEM
jgi:hypothetical protein